MKSILDFLLTQAAKLIIPLIGKMEPEKALRLGAFLGRMYFYLSSRRHYAYADLKKAFPGRYAPAERWKIIRDHYEHLGQNVMEFCRIPVLSSKEIEGNVAVHHMERFQKALEQSKGIIFLTAHFGNWELMQVVSGLKGKPIHVLARPQKFPRLDDYMNEIRQSHGSVAVMRGMGIRDLIRALKRKEIIGMLGDQDAGKNEGMILPFLGRKTTVPTGPFELAARTESILLPCFIVRGKNGKHEIFIEEPIDCSGMIKNDKELKLIAEKYVHLLETFIEKNPSHWLWASKRWKHSWTKRLVILSDGKQGHVKQSEALAGRMNEIKSQYKRPGMEYPIQTIPVTFRSKVHRILFPWITLLILPWIQGRLSWLRFFFTEETQQQLETASPDFVISAGSSVAPLNLCLSRECRSKSIVLMKPSFPYHFFRYDLAVIGAHDQGWIPQESFRTLLTLSPEDETSVERAGSEILSQLKEDDTVKISIFLGGPTQSYSMDLADVEKMMRSLERFCHEQKCGYVLTTSRRTPAAISHFLKNRITEKSACRMLVIAEEDSRREVVPGFMALADILIVTEDSISMISEAVRSGKRVVVLSFQKPGLPVKHQRFRAILARESMVTVASILDLENKIREAQSIPQAQALKDEEAALAEKLQAIL